MKGERYTTTPPGRRLVEWWLWRRAQRAINAAFPSAVLISDNKRSRR